MKMDYSEFIARHHRVAAPEPIEAPRRRDYEGIVTIIILIIFSISSICVVAFTRFEWENLQLLGSIAAVVALSTAVMAFRSYLIHSRYEHELDLVREVLEGSRGSRLITDSADNTIYFNRKFEKLCRGVGPTTLATLTRLFHDGEENESASHFDLLAEQAQKGITDSIELFSKYEDTERWLMVTAQPVLGYAGHVHWRIDDVTQKYTVDSAIREEREKLIDFTDNAPVGFFSLDEDGKFVFANATFARWVGEDLRTLLSTGVLHTYLADPPKDANPYDLTEESRPRQVVEVRMKGAAGKTFLASINQVIVIEADGRVRTRAVIHDLTSERKMSQALQASEDRFQRFFEEAPVGIVLINRDGLISDCNSAFAVMLDQSIDDLERQEFATLITDEDRDRATAAIEKIDTGQRMNQILEIGVKGKGVEKIVLQMHAKKFSQGGHVVLHFIDVTEQKSLETQFVQSQKMQAIGQLAGGIAHDFNNLLTAMIGFCDLLLLRHKPGDPSFSDIQQIKQNSNRASNLVRQLLAFSRQQTLRPKVQDITDILTEVSSLLRRLIGAGIELDLIHGGELGLVKVDEGQMDQVFMNMAVNARDAMNGTGSLTIESQNYSNTSPKELISEELPVGHWTLIKVTDTGTGIEKDTLEHIFEPFFTTKEVGEGTGLGLATVYGIIRQTDGFLDVQSKIGQGTTFSIYLPRASEIEEEEAAQETDKEEDEIIQDLTGTERILLVEDEDAVRTFAERALTNKGYEVFSAYDGENALEVYEAEKEGGVNLLVTDVVMPGMDGPTLAQRLRQENPDLKIIFMSGYTEDKLKDHMGKGIYFLPKPFTLKALAAKVKEVLAE